MPYEYFKPVRDMLVSNCIVDILMLIANHVCPEDAASQLSKKYGNEIVFRAIIRIEDLCEL